MHKPLLFLLGLGLTGNTFAGCGEGHGTCYYYKAGELQGQDQCAVTTCAATDQYFFSTWSWENGNQVEITTTQDRQGTLVNGKSGYVLPFSFKDERLICYAISASSELLCNDSGVY